MALTRRARTGNLSGRPSALTSLPTSWRRSVKMLPGAHRTTQAIGSLWASSLPGVDSVQASLASARPCRPPATVNPPARRSPGQIRFWAQQLPVTGPAKTIATIIGKTAYHAVPEVPSPSWRRRSADLRARDSPSRWPACLACTARTPGHLSRRAVGRRPHRTRSPGRSRRAPGNFHRPRQGRRQAGQTPTVRPLKFPSCSAG